MKYLFSLFLVLIPVMFLSCGKSEKKGRTLNLPDFTLERFKESGLKQSLIKGSIDFSKYASLLDFFIKPLEAYLEKSILLLGRALRTRFLSPELLNLSRVKSGKL